MTHQSQGSTSIPAVESYSHRGNPAFEAEMALRTAAKEGAFFLPFLRPGMRVLDLGCGPGSITLGLAQAVAPGEAIGVDLQPSQVAQAQALGAARGVMNVRFEVADVYQLPFPDGSFDAVFGNAVLMHLRKPVPALVEVRRVLDPGGIVGVRDCDWGGRIHAPMTPLFDHWYTLTVRVRQRNGGDPLHGPSSPPAPARCRVCAGQRERVCLDCGDTGGNEALCQLSQGPTVRLRSNCTGGRLDGSDNRRGCGGRVRRMG